MPSPQSRDGLGPYHARQRVARKGRRKQRKQRSVRNRASSPFLTENRIVGGPGVGGDHGSTEQTPPRSSSASMMLELGTFLSAHIRVDPGSKKRAALNRTTWNIVISDVGLSRTTAGIEVHALSSGGQYSLRSFLPIKKLKEVMSSRHRRRERQQQQQREAAEREGEGPGHSRNQEEESEDVDEAELRKALKRYRNADQRLTHYLADAANSGNYSTNLNMTLCRIINGGLRVTSAGAVSKIFFKFGQAGNSKKKAAGSAANSSHSTTENRSPTRKSEQPEQQRGASSPEQPEPQGQGGRQAVHSKRPSSAAPGPRKAAQRSRQKRPSTANHTVRPRRSWRSVKTSAQLPSNPGVPRSRAAIKAEEEDAAKSPEELKSAKLRRRVSDARQQAETSSKAEGDAAARLQAFARGQKKRREFFRKRGAARKIQQQWTAQMTRRLIRKKLDASAHARQWAGTVLTTVWRNFKRHKVSVVRKAVITLQSRWRAHQAMKHVSEHRAMYDMVLGPAVRKMQAAFRARITRRRLRIQGMKGVRDRSKPKPKPQKPRKQGPLSAGLLAKLGSGHRLRRDFSDFDNGDDEATAEDNNEKTESGNSSNPPASEGGALNKVYGDVVREHAAEKSKQQRPQKHKEQQQQQQQQQQQNSQGQQKQDQAPVSAQRKEEKTIVTASGSVQNADRAGNPEQDQGKQSQTEPTVVASSDATTTNNNSAAEPGQKAFRGFRELKQVAHERRQGSSTPAAGTPSNGRSVSAGRVDSEDASHDDGRAAPSSTAAVVSKEQRTVHKTSRAAQTDSDLAPMLEQENARLMTTNMSLMREHEEAAKVLAAQKAMVKNILATAMKTNAAEQEELKAKIHRLELSAQEAATLKETEMEHLRASHRSELMAVRVKLEQLSGESGVLRDSAGSAAQEIKGLLQKVDDLTEQNRALKQQNALEVAKVNAVKQEMLQLDAQHRQLIREAEARTMETEVATERHFTTDREQLLKSHARLVQALERQHRTKLSILEERIATMQADRDASDKQWAAQMENSDSIVKDLQDQLAERKRALRAAENKIAKAREVGAQDAEEKYLRQIEAERRGWTNQLKVAGEAAASHKDALSHARLRQERTDEELKALREEHEELEKQHTSERETVRSLESKLEDSTRELTTLKDKLSADAAKHEKDIAAKEEQIKQLTSEVTAGEARENDAGETILALGAEIEKLEEELREKSRHAAESETRIPQEEVDRIKAEFATERTNLKSELTKAQDEAKRLQAEVEDARKQAADATAQQQEDGEHRKRADEAAAELEKTKQQLAAAETKTAKATRECQQLRKALEMDSASTKASLSDAESRASSAETAAREAASKAEEAEIVTAEARAEMEELRRKLAATQQELQSSKLENEKNKKTIRSLDATNRKLMTEKVKAAAEATPSNTDNSKAGAPTEQQSSSEQNTDSTPATPAAQPNDEPEAKTEAQKEAEREAAAALKAERIASKKRAAAEKRRLRLERERVARQKSKAAKLGEEAAASDQHSEAAQHLAAEIERLKLAEGKDAPEGEAAEATKAGAGAKSESGASQADQTSATPAAEKSAPSSQNAATEGTQATETAPATTAN